MDQPPPDVDHEPGHGPAVAGTPWWFEQALLVVTISVVSWGAAGLLLADHGKYTLTRAALLGSVGTLVAIAVAALRHRDRPATDPRWAPTIAMIFGAGGVGLWNAIHAGHHLTGDRDPGIYMLAGKWIAKHGTLIVPAGAGWPASVPQLTLSSAGMYVMPDRTVQFQFAHFLPALLAEGNGIGGDRLMYRVNALVGALALLVLFAVGCRLCRRPWIVAAAVLGLGVSIPEINCVRDSFSEPSTQLVLWGAVWLLALAFEHRSGWRHVAVALLGGAALGATVMTRIDGMAYFIFVPPLAAIAWTMRGRGNRRDLVRAFIAVIVGAAPFVAIGTYDVQRRSGYYYHDLHHDVFSLYGAFAAMSVVSLIGVLIWPHLGVIRDWIVDRRVGLATIVAWVAITGLTLAWSVRPAIQKLRLHHGPNAPAYIAFTSGLQRGEGLMPDGLRTYGERSVEWLSWYLGPVALILAIGGLGWVIVRLVRRGSPALAITLFVAGPSSAEYLWNSHITGDQPWAMRRFLPAALPLCALLAAVAASRVRDVTGRSFANRHAGWMVTAFAALGLVAFPLGRTLPVRALTTNSEVPAAIKQVCATVGPRAALLSGPDILGDVYAQTLRDWCNVPSMRLRSALDPETARALTAMWKAKGRTLWIIGQTSEALQPIAASRPRLVVDTTSTHGITLTLSRPPDQYASKRLTIWAAPVI